MTPSDSALQRKLLLAAFQMPAVATLVSRKSSITNAFVNTLIPQIIPSLEEIEQALKILGMDLADVRCAYCGDKMTEWDHLLACRRRLFCGVRKSDVPKFARGKTRAAYPFLRPWQCLS